MIEYIHVCFERPFRQPSGQIVRDISGMPLDFRDTLRSQYQWTRHLRLGQIEEKESMNSADVFPGLLHRISKTDTEAFSHQPLVAFQHTPESQSRHPTNTIIFLPGLSDGLLSVPFVPFLVSALPPSWTFVEPSMLILLPL